MTLDKATQVIETPLNSVAEVTALPRALEALENLMLETVRSEVAILQDASRHVLEAGGKRIRPQVLLLSYLATGGNNLASTLPIAAAVELVHTASVVHDDINDHGVLRRGRPSVNALWGRTFALLTGDFLFTKVYELMAPYKDLNITLAEATSALVEGETLQAAAVKQGHFSREVYYRIIALKTAALFRAAARLGAQLADASAKQVDALGQFGYYIGLAFQIVDDILDLTADAAQLGKAAGIDLAQGRGYAAAHGNGHGNQASNDVDAGDPMLAIKQRLLNDDTLAEAREQARQFVELANSSVAGLPKTEAKVELLELSRLVIQRER